MGLQTGRDEVADDAEEIELMRRLVEKYGDLENVPQPSNGVSPEREKAELVVSPPPLEQV